MGKFCPNCGAMVNAAPASGTAGELVLPGALPVLSPFGSGERLSAVLQDGLRKLLKGTKTVLADKKRLFLAVSLALIWLVLNLLGAYGLFPLPVWLLSWLTAARGGLIGGSVGKGLVAALFARLLTDKGTMSALKNGFSRLKVTGGKEDWPSLLLGGGAALIAANLLVASTFQNSMVAIAALFHSLLALRENGFLYRLFSALLPQRDNRTIGLIMQGWALGFLLFTGLCLLPGRANGYLGGLLLLAAFVVLKFGGKDKKEVAAG